MEERRKEERKEVDKMCDGVGSWELEDGRCAESK